MHNSIEKFENIVNEYKSAYRAENKCDVMVIPTGDNFSNVLVKGEHDSNHFQYTTDQLVNMTLILRTRTMLKSNNKSPLEKEIESIRGKLTPITNLISILEMEQIITSINDVKLKEILEKSILASKEVINELADREVYKLNKNEKNNS